MEGSDLKVWPSRVRCTVSKVVCLDSYPPIYSRKRVSSECGDATAPMHVGRNVFALPGCVP